MIAHAEDIQEATPFELAGGSKIVKKNAQFLN